MVSSGNRNAFAGPSSSSSSGTGPGASANGGRPAGPVRPTKLQVIPSTWEGTISAPIEEKDPAVFLHSMAQVLDEYHLPTKRHLHLLLFLTLTSDPPLAPLAIRTFSHLLSLLSPSALAPLLPSVTSHSAEDPDWFTWDEPPKGSIDRSVRRFMRRAIDSGVWALLAEYKVKGKEEDALVKVERELKLGAGAVKLESGKKGRGRPRASKTAVVQPEEEEEEEEQEEVEEEEDEEREGEREEAMGRKGEKFIGGKGWEVLGLFVEMWREDQREHLAKHPNESWSPLFLQQLPQPYVSRDRSVKTTLQMDDASLALKAIRAGLLFCAADDVESSEKRRVREICAGILRLLLDATTPQNAPFHPPSLLLSLITLFRPLSPSSLRTAFSFIPASTPLYAHLLALGVEDLAGVRGTNVSERKRSAEIFGREFDLKWREEGDEAAGSGAKVKKVAFPPPRVSFLATLLLLQPQTASEAGKMGRKSGAGGGFIGGPETPEKMGWLKRQLVLWAGVHQGPGPEWGFGKDEAWAGRLKQEMPEGEGEEILELIRDLEG